MSVHKGIIYKITNLVNKMCYIGQTNNLKSRWNQHKNSINSQKGTCPAIKNAILEFGIENFEIETLEEIDNWKYDLIDEREMYWIETLGSLWPNGYNLQLFKTYKEKVL